MNIDTFIILKGGSCSQIERLTTKKGKWKSIHFPALFFLIKHPSKGYLLMDTGYASHFLHETKKFPYSFYAKTTPLSFSKEESALEQLGKLGIQPTDIQYVFISHFHADHIAGLRDFSSATFICSKKAYNFLLDKKGIFALKHAFIPALLPKDFHERVLFIEDFPLATRIKNSSFVRFFPTIYDLFGDGTLLSVDLSGHAIGQFGLFFQHEKKDIFLIADASWDSDSVRHYTFPSKLAELILYDVTLFKNTLYAIHQFHQFSPDTLIIPSHCREIPISERTLP